MTNILRKAILGSVLIALLGSSAWAQGRIATVDLPKLFNGYWKKKQADATIKETRDDLTKGYNDLRDEFKKANEDYQTILSSAKDPAVSAEEREKRNKAAENALKHLKDLEDTIRKYEVQAEANINEKGQRLKVNLITEIRNVISAKAKASSYTLVLDASADSMTPVVLFSNGENDITEAVLAELNRTAPPDTAKPEEKPAEKKADNKK
jgi:Skp family chaperone for outer membrane proteins